MLLNNSMKVFSLNNGGDNQGSHQGNCNLNAKIDGNCNNNLNTMIKLKTLIVDDELHGRESLVNLINEYCPEIEVVGEAESASSAKKLVYEKNPDVVFLDINMPVVDGFDFLESLPEKQFAVVFVTAHMEYGIRAVKAHAVDYLLKPVSIKELQQCVKTLVEMHSGKSTSGASQNGSGNEDKIVLSHFQGFSIHRIDEIIRLEADDNYTVVYLKDKTPITISKTLKHFEDCCGNSFFRIHKSHLINLKYLKEFSNLDGGFAIMDDGSKLPVSRRKYSEFMEKAKNSRK
jgi:two-component system, LytTR family, response regulator